VYFLDYPDKEINDLGARGIGETAWPASLPPLRIRDILIALAAVGTVLLLGLWSMVSGGSLNISQRVMRWRVVLQFIAALPRYGCPLSVG
jgi:hypothetical protein